MTANDKARDPAASIGQVSQLRRRRFSAAENLVIHAPTFSASEEESSMSKQLPSCPASSCGDDEGHAGHAACPSNFACGSCAEVLHELANVMTAVLTNTQVLSWKLPPYSHLKRSVREVERNAQRGGELLRRLANRCAEKAPAREVQR